MTRNYTAVKRYLLAYKDKKGELAAIDTTKSETWRNGGDTQNLVKKYSQESLKCKRIREEIEERISRVEDKRQQFILRQHYLRFKSGYDIECMTGWNEKFIRNMYERALMNMEIILLDDGILTFVDPRADMMADYEDGYRKGYEEGKSCAYDSGYKAGYEEGYDRGEKGLPYDEDEEDDDEEEDYDEEDEDGDEY